MKPIFPLVAAITILLPSIAHADDKADAILKEVRLRMHNTTAYSVTLQLIENGKQVLQIRGLFQRPDKYLFGITDGNKPEAVIIMNGNRTVTRQGDLAFPMSDKEAKEVRNTFMPLISADFPRLFVKKVKETRYITQKMWDETTVVDVVDVIGESPDETVRVYIDNNSLVRKITGVSKGRKVGMHFLNPTTNPLITAKTFAVE